MSSRPQSHAAPHPHSPHAADTGANLDDAAVLTAVARAVDAAGVFGEVAVVGSRLSAAAKASGDAAFYRVDLLPAGAVIALVTPARYLSQSIEADLVNTGDKLDDLLSDELIDQGYSGPALRVEHFRDPEKLFTFQSRLPQAGVQVRSSAGVAMLAQVLLAYEACFRPLGDMNAADEE